MEDKIIYKCENPNHNNNINDSSILNYCYSCKIIICSKCLNYICINKHKVDLLENALKKAKEELNRKEFMINKNITYMKLKNNEEFMNQKLKSFYVMCNNLSNLYKNKCNEYSNNYEELKNQQNKLKENIKENSLSLLNISKNHNENIVKIENMYNDLIFQTKFINYIYHKTSNLLSNNSINYNDRFTIFNISSNFQKESSPPKEQHIENKLNEKKSEILEANKNENELNNNELLKADKKTDNSHKNHLFVCLNIKTKRNEKTDLSMDNNKIDKENYKKSKIQDNLNTTINNDRKTFGCSIKLIQKNKEINENSNKIINININKNSNFINNNEFKNIKIIFGIQNNPYRLVVFELKPNSFSNIEYIEDKNYIFKKCNNLPNFPYKKCRLLNINNNEAFIIGGEDIYNCGYPGNKFCYKINYINDNNHKGKIICTQMASTFYGHQLHSLLYSKLYNIIFIFSGSQQKACEYSKINENGEIDKWEPFLFLKESRENCLSFLINEEYIYLVGGNENKDNINYDKFDISELNERKIIFPYFNIKINNINNNLFESKELGIFVKSKNIFILGGCNLNDGSEIKAWKISFEDFNTDKLFENIENINVSYLEEHKSELLFLKDYFINTINNYYFISSDGICKRIPKSLLKI